MSTWDRCGRATRLAWWRFYFGIRPHLRPAAHTVLWFAFGSRLGCLT